MGLFGRKKNKEDVEQKRLLDKQNKENELKKELSVLQEINASHFGKVCKAGNLIFIPIRFEIIDNVIHLVFIYEQTIKGYINNVPYERFKLRYGKNLFESRLSWKTIENKVESIKEIYEANL